MPFTTPPTAITGTIVQAQHRNILRDNDNWFNQLLGAGPTGTNQMPILSGPSAGAFGSLTPLSFQAGACTNAKMAAAIISTAKITDASMAAGPLAGSVTAALFPVGLVMMVRTVAEIPATWERETALNGRFLVNAGASFDSITFVEGSDYGSSWAHGDHSWSGTTGTPTVVQTNIDTITPQQAQAASPVHTHIVSGQVSAATWTIPSRGYVFMRKAS